MLIRNEIHDHIVWIEKDEKNIHEAYLYLKEHLSLGEAKTIFQAAHDHKSADFENNETHHNYSLMYKGNNEYILMSRS